MSEYEFNRLVRRLEDKKNDKAVTKSTQKMQGDMKGTIWGRGGAHQQNTFLLDNYFFFTFPYLVILFGLVTLVSVRPEGW